MGDAPEVAALREQHSHFGIITGLRMVGSPGRSLNEGGLGHLAAAGDYQDMGAWDALGVQPEVFRAGQLPGGFFVLQGIAADDDGKAIHRAQAHGPGARDGGVTLAPGIRDQTR